MAAAEKFGSQCIVVAIDAKPWRRREQWEIFTHGGRQPTGIERAGFADEPTLGAGEILLTSMDRDGTKAGFDIALTRAVADASDVPVIASGGVGDLDHLVAGIARRRYGGARRLDLSFRTAYDPGSQGIHGRSRHPHAARSVETGFRD